MLSTVAVVAPSTVMTGTPVRGLCLQGFSVRVPHPCEYSNLDYHRSKVQSEGGMVFRHPRDGRRAMKYTSLFLAGFLVAALAAPAGADPGWQKYFTPPKNAELKAAWTTGGYVGCGEVMREWGALPT
jgi:hypothetical protein